MDPASRKLIRVSVDDEIPGETGDLVDAADGQEAGAAVSVYSGERAVPWRSWMFEVNQMLMFGGQFALNVVE